MSYWRMQLHPNKRHQASFQAAKSLAAGFIGLDFAKDVGDMLRIKQQALPIHHRDYYAFAHKMRIGDLVLVITHHFPFALVQVTGDYNYIRTPEPELGVWFRHFRRVDNVHYYADFVTNAAAWEKITMTDTISPLHDTDSASYRLIELWKKHH